MSASARAAVPRAAAVIPAAAINAGAAAVAPASPVGKNASWVSHDSGPIARRSLPSEMLRNAPNDVGVELGPGATGEFRSASAAVPGFLYERKEVMTSKASATATMRAANEDVGTVRPFG